MIRVLASRPLPLASRVLVAALLSLVLAGCDKCGNRVKFNAPSLPDACGENANPAR